MPIYLYKKTHLVTGLQYLGKTSRDPHKYKGSGKYWKLHLKIHGDNVLTEVLKECDTDEELSYWGKHYSEMWDVVKNDQWANLVEETGQGVTHNDHTISKMLETRNKNGSYTRTESHTKHHMESRIRNGTLNTQTPERVSRQLETRRKNGTLNPNTPGSSEKRWETRRKNGKDKRTEESKEKQKNTRVERGIVNNNSIKKTCPHCGKVVGLPNYAKYHGDKCKMRIQNGNEKEIS